MQMQSTYRMKGLIYLMVLISKEERKAIGEKFPKAGVVRTMRQKSKRGRYYCEESREVMKFLNNLRRANVIEEYPPRKKRNR